MERNYSVDIVKIVSMFMVVVLHILSHGNILENVKYGSLNYYVVWCIYTIALCAVNCFVLSSGYIMIQKNFDYNQIIKLWLQVAFYSILLTLVVIVCKTDELNISNIMRSFFPIIKEQYWYVTAYFGMIVFVPFINKLINNLNEKQLFRLIIFLIVVFSFGTTISRIDVFKLNNGFSVAWFFILYIIGCWLKKSSIEKSIKKNHLLISFMLMSGITFCSKIIIELLSVIIFGRKMSGQILFGYTSPTILFSAIFLFLFIIKIKVKKPLIKKIVKKLIPLNFSVYLIHDHLLIRKNIISKLSILNIYTYDTLKMIFMIFSLTLLIYICCVLIDSLRVTLFKKANVDVISKQIIKVIRKKSNSFEDIILRNKGGWQ